MLSFFTSRPMTVPTTAHSAGAPQPTKKPTPAKKPTPTPTKKPTPAKKPTPTPTPKKPEANTGLGKDQLVLSPKKPTPPSPPPETPVAETAEQAVAAAIKGEPIKIKVDFGAPRELKLKPSGEAAGEQRYAAELGSQTFQLAIAPGQGSDAALARSVRVLAFMPELVLRQLTTVRITDASLEADAFSLEFANLHGKPATVAFKRTGTDGERAVYDMQHEGQTVKVLVHQEEDLPYELGKMATFIAQVPPRHRPTLKTVIIHNGGNPLDAYWAKTYNMPGFVSGASAASGVINFWNAQRNLSDSTFHHEFGHLLGQRLSKDNGFTPPGWEDAIQSDNAAPSSYANASPTEDFAESWSAFVRLKAGEPVYTAGTRTEAEFIEKYPARAKMLQAIYDSDAVAATAETAKSGGAPRLIKPCACRGCDGSQKKKPA